MTFLAPIFLWTLLALIPLGAVYLMKTRPRKRVTNALFLWQKVLQESATQFWLRKMRNLLSLLIMMLAFILACLSLTKPQIGKSQQQDLLIILDQSASMQTDDGGQTRFERAQAEVRDYLRAVDGGTRVAFATVSDTLQYHSHLTTNTRGITEPLGELRPTELPLNPAALQQLEMFVTESEELENSSVPSIRILFVTDGAYEAQSLPEHVETIIIGEGSDNIGISAGDLALMPNGRAKLFFTLTSACDHTQEVELELRHVETGQVAKFITTSVAPTQPKTEVVEIEEAVAGHWELVLLRDDQLATDNLLALGLNIPDPIQVAVSTSNAYFYNRCVQAFGHSENLFTLAEPELAQILIAEGQLANTTQHHILIAPVESSKIALEVAGVLPSVIAETDIGDHPLLAHLQPDQLTLAGGRSLVAPSGATIVLQEIDGTPLIYTIEQDGQKSVVMNFDPAVGEFYLSPSFPILIHNAARYLANREQELAATYQVGSSVTLPLRGAEVTQYLQPTTGDRIETALTGRESSLSALGAYRYETSSQQLYTGAGLLSRPESGPSPVVAENSMTESISKGFPLAWFLLLFAVLFVLVEEALYHRRKVG